jgi:plastocyanin
MMNKAAQRGPPKWASSCPTKVSVHLRGGQRIQPTDDARELTAFDNLGGNKMKRMTLLLIAGLTFIGIALSASLAMADDNKDRDSNVTVSFGQWDPNDPDLNNNPPRFPLDRLVDDPSAGRGNNHELLPKVVKISTGDSVSFIISGGHILAVYDDGTKPGDIGDAIESPCVGTGPFLAPCSPLSGTPPAPTAGGIISHSDKRIYRGAFLNLVRRDGVEVVKFTKPGTYLVICARFNHFVDDGMFGFVEVKKEKGKN